MTNPNTEKPVTVTQADRLLFKRLTLGNDPLAAEMNDRGVWDNDDRMIAIARHREQAERDTIAGAAGESFDASQVLDILHEELEAEYVGTYIAGMDKAAERIAALSTPPTPGIDAGREQELLDLISEAEMLRTVGDTLADELSVLRHTSHISGAAVDATKDWDALTFALRSKFRAALSPNQGDA